MLPKKPSGIYEYWMTPDRFAEMKAKHKTIGRKSYEKFKATKSIIDPKRKGPAPRYELFAYGSDPDKVGNPSEKIGIYNKPGTGRAYYEPFRPCNGCGKLYRPDSTLWRKGGGLYCKAGCFQTATATIRIFAYRSDPLLSGDHTQKIGIRTKNGRGVGYYEPVRKCDGCKRAYRPLTIRWNKGEARYCSSNCHNSHTSQYELFSYGTNPDVVGDPYLRICIKSKRGGLVYYEPIRPCDFCKKPYRPDSARWRLGAVRHCSSGCASGAIYEKNRQDLTAFQKRRAMARDSRQYIQLAMKGRISDEACFRLNGWTPSQLILHLSEELKKRHPKAHIRYWGKRGHKYHLEVDHIRPVSSFVKEDPDTPLCVINALSNLQLLLKADNNRKKDKFDPARDLISKKFWIIIRSQKS